MNSRFSIAIIYDSIYNILHNRGDYYERPAKHPKEIIQKNIIIKQYRKGWKEYGN